MEACSSLDAKKATLSELLSRWNEKLEKQSTQFIALAAKVTACDRVLYDYFTSLQRLERGLSEVFVGARAARED